MPVQNATSAVTVDHQHQRHTGVLIIYLVGVIAVLASAIILTIVLTTVLHSSTFLWPLTLIGAVIIVALLSAAALPAFRPDR